LFVFLRRSGGDEDDDKRDERGGVFKKSLVSVRRLENGREKDYYGEEKEGEGSGGEGELDLATGDGSDTEKDERKGSNDKNEVVFVEIKEVGSSRKEEKGNKESSEGENSSESDGGYFVECFPHISILIVDDPVVKANFSVKRFVGGEDKRTIFFGSNRDGLVNFGVRDDVDVGVDGDFRIDDFKLGLVGWKDRRNGDGVRFVLG